VDAFASESFLDELAALAGLDALAVLEFIQWFNKK